jgi:molybdopterin synthase sulfur carrier subunit
MPYGLEEGVEGRPPATRLAGAVAVLMLFAQAREAAGTNRAEFDGATVGEVLTVARHRFGAGFAAVLEGSKVWLNGEPAAEADPVGASDEVAVLPPVSGG